MAKKDCFVIAPIGEADSETRKRSDQVLKHVISPAVDECGYKATRADQISEPGMITSQVIQHIVEDPLVIADLTERNPNVFYELAIRHAIRKPLVQLIKKGEQIPFDVAGTRTIHLDHRDLDSVEEAKKEIIAQVKSLEKDSSTLETPISVSLDLQILRQSDNPEQRSLADVLSVISELRNSVVAIEKRLENVQQTSSALTYMIERERGWKNYPTFPQLDKRESDQLTRMEVQEALERIQSSMSEKPMTKREVDEMLKKKIQILKNKLKAT